MFFYRFIVRIWRWSSTEQLFFLLLFLELSIKYYNIICSSSTITWLDETGVRAVVIITILPAYDLLCFDYCINNNIFIFQRSESSKNCIFFYFSFHFVTYMTL